MERGPSRLLGGDWHLDWVEAVDVQRGHTYRWRCRQWFSSKEGLKKEWSLDAAKAGQAQPLELETGPAELGGGRIAGGEGGAGMGRKGWDKGGWVRRGTTAGAGGGGRGVGSVREDYSK